MPTSFPLVPKLLLGNARISRAPALGESCGQCPPYIRLAQNLSRGGGVAGEVAATDVRLAPLARPDRLGGAEQTPDLAAGSGNTELRSKGYFL